MTYLDTGCLVKLYYPEPDSARIISLVQAKPIIYTPLHELEFTNALQLKFFFKNATIAQITSARTLVETDLASGVLVSAGADWTNIFQEATELARQYSGTIGCRSLDVLHCAAAKMLKAAEFVSTDLRQKEIAMRMGLNLIAV